jgi:uncharacterized membrane protein YfcA
VQIAIWAIVGLGIGAYGTLVGAGGGFLMVPIFLFFIPGITPAEAAGTSLTVVFFNGLSGTASYIRQGRVDFRTGIIFAMATIPGSISGAYLSERFANRAFYVTFGLLLIGIAILLNLRPDPRRAAALAAPETDGEPPPPRRGRVRRSLVDRHGERFAYEFNLVGGIVLSFFVGFISSIFGIGGGPIHVPAMVLLFHFPPHIATATSTFILTISAFTGALSHVLAGNIRWIPMIGLTIGVIPGALVGAHIARHVHGAWLLRALSLALVVAGVRLVFKT